MNHQEKQKRVDATTTNFTSHHAGPAGDSTFGPLHPSDITNISPSFLALIDPSGPPNIDGPLPPPPLPTLPNGTFSLSLNELSNNDGQTLSKPHQPNEEPPTSVRKRSPGEIQGILKVPQKKPTLKDSQKTIEALQQENFKLKVFLDRVKRGGDFDYESNKQDLVDILLAEREELTKRLESKEAKESKKTRTQFKDAASQTNLDMMNINEMTKDCIDHKICKLRKRQNEEQSAPFPRNSTPQPTHQMPHHHHHHPYTHHNQYLQQTQVQQLHYTSATLPRNRTANKSMTPEEKTILEKLFNLNGLLTTVRDKALAKKELETETRN